MKHVLTFATLLASLAALAQNPNYDPDSNGDNLIGAEDLQSFLAVYNTMLTSEQATIGYVTDFDSAGVFSKYGDLLPYYRVPDSVDVVLVPDSIPSYSAFYVVLNPLVRRMLTVETSGLVGGGTDQDSIVRVVRQNSGHHLNTWLFIDGKWYCK